jgi:hypothetical protein
MRLLVDLSLEIKVLDGVPPTKSAIKDWHGTEHKDELRSMRVRQMPHAPSLEATGAEPEGTTILQ